jgi:hypothetical protein
VSKSFALRGAVVACSTATAALIGSLGFFKFSAKTALAEPPVLSPAVLASVLGRLGLDARSLTAAGVDSSSISAVVGAGRDALASRLTAIQAADQSVRENLASVERLERIAVAGVASEADLSRLAAARTQLGSARTTLATLLSEVSDSAESLLGVGQRLTLATIRQPAAANLATQHRVAAWSVTDQAALRDAVAHIRTAEASGQSPAAPARQRVLDANARSEVVAAASHLSDRLVANTAAWGQAVGG